MYCENCGCKVYNGHCVNCHEETYIYYQNISNDELVPMSDEFMNKVSEQNKEAKKIKNIKRGYKCNKKD